MPAAPPWHASPSALNGVAMQFDEIGARRSALGAGDPARRVEHEARSPSKWPTNVRASPPTSRATTRRACGRENVMSGRVESLTTFEIGWPPLTSSKWSPHEARDEDRVGARRRCPRSTRPTARSCRRASACRPRRAGPRRPGRGPRSASSLSSAACDSAHEPKPCGAARVEHVRLPGGAVADGDCQWKPPSRRGVGDGLGREHLLVARAGRSPLASCSYQTTHGTVSFGPVKAMSGSTPSRVGSMFSVGSPVALTGRRVGVQALEADLLPAEAR